MLCNEQLLVDIEKYRCLQCRASRAREKYRCSLWALNHHLLVVWTGVIARFFLHALTVFEGRTNSVNCTDGAHVL